MSKLKHEGRQPYRLKNNPMERAFARAWKERNTVAPGMMGHGILDYLLADDSNRPLDEVTERDASVAATVVQWLGSPVGQCFVRDVLLKEGLVVARKKDSQKNHGEMLITRED